MPSFDYYEKPFGEQNQEKDKEITFPLKIEEK
jgi:hypothetical protein